MPIEPKLLRYMKGTHRNKKTGLYEHTINGRGALRNPSIVRKYKSPPTDLKIKQSKVRKCPNGTRRNKKTGSCEKTSNERIGSLLLHSIDEHKRVKSIKKENPFITLCKKYIMDSNLDNVVKKVWLNKEDCNIFLIGENHKPHERCTSILDMFKELFRENDKNPVHIDVLVELLPINVYFYASNPNFSYTTEGNLQMHRIRHLLAPCVQMKGSCSHIHVHWADPGQDIRDRLPKWLKELNKLPLLGYTWKENPDISHVLRNKEDVSKILTENVMTVKEIKKAEKIFPNFTIKFAVDLIMGWIDYPEYDWEYIAVWISRWVMDFYTAARIIKSKFKNVIFYAGNVHTEHVIEILTKLGFNTVDTVLGDEKCINY